MIPKIIHYCWFGGNPLPELALKCIESWRNFFPDYEIKEWNESNFDVNTIPYTKEAYELKKYAFVSDYARFWILYKYGGLYFDTDVEIVKSFDSILGQGPFMGCESDADIRSGTIQSVAPGLGLGVDSGHAFYKDMLELYAKLHFVDANGNMNEKTIVCYTTELLIKKGLVLSKGVQCVDSIWIYPKTYFCPMDAETKKIQITSQTFSIHHYDGSWLSQEQKYANYLMGKWTFFPRHLRMHLTYLFSVAKFYGIHESFRQLLQKIKKHVINK